VPCEPPFEAWVEPPTDARRHLARPLAWEASVQTDRTSKR
jgi:tRNA(Ile2) C34 agmatinyltransferase TiaS